MAVRIVSLMARLGLDGTGFQQGMKDAGLSADKLKTMLARTFGAAATVAFLRSVIQTASEIKNMAEQFSLTTDEVQRLEATAEKSGLKFEDLGKAVLKLNDLRRKAIENDEDAIKSARRLGLALDDLLNLDVTSVALLEKIGASLKDAKIDPQTSMALRDLFGGGGNAEKGQRIVQSLRDLTTTNPMPIFAAETISILDKVQRKGVTVWKNIKAAAANSMAGLAVLFGIRPDRAPPNNNIASFVGVSDEDLKEHIRLLKAARAERERLAGGPLKPGTPEYGPRAMTLLGANPDLAMSFKEDEAILAEAEAELERRKNSMLQQQPTDESLRAKGQLSQQEAEKVLALRDRLFQSNLKLLGQEERRAAIARRILDIEEKARKFIGPERESDILKRQEDLADLRSQLTGEFKGGKGDYHRRDLTGLQQSGAFAGLSFGRAFALSQFSSKKTDDEKEIRKATQQAAQLLKSIDSKITTGVESLTF